MSNLFRNYFYDENYQIKTELVLNAGKKLKNKVLRSVEFDLLLRMDAIKYQSRPLYIRGFPLNFVVESC